MKGRIRYGALLFACAFLLAMPGSASAKLFLELDGIPGEATDEGFVNQIELSSFQFGIGKSKDKAPSFSDISVTKTLDISSPELMLRVANGATIPSARVRFTRASDEGQEVFLRYCFTGVRITGFSQQSGGDAPSESVTFNYGTIVQAYTPPGSSGPAAWSGWDLIRNLQFNGACDN